MEEINVCDPKEKKSRWKTIIEAISSPMDFLQHWSSKSPLLTVLAVVFLLQPVISTSIDLIDEWRSVKTDLDPQKRPVTKAELDIVNQKVDFVQQLIVTEMNNRHTHENISVKPHISTPEPASTPDVVVPTQKLQALQSQLDNVQKKLDNDYAKQKTAKK